MRMYFFNNMYLAGIHAGIQAGHAAVRMMNEHKDSAELAEWANNHETFIILNGGDSTALEAIVDDLSENTGSYVYSTFMEPGVNNSITSVALLVREEVYEASARIRKGDVYATAGLNIEDIYVAEFLTMYGLM